MKMSGFPVKGTYLVQCTDCCCILHESLGKVYGIETAVPGITLLGHLSDSDYTRVSNDLMEAYIEFPRRE